MLNVIEWFLFGMFVWACCIGMQALQRRFAPEMGDCSGMGTGKKGRKARRKQRAERTASGSMFSGEDPRDTEIRELRERLQVLEAIVTDRRFQWEQDYSSDRRG